MALLLIIINKPSYLVPRQPLQSSELCALCRYFYMDTLKGGKRKGGQSEYNIAATLNRTVTRSINGFNTRCLHVMTGEHYRETATAPAYDLVLAVMVRLDGSRLSCRVPVITATSRNSDNKNGDMPKRRHSKTATTRVKTATTRVKTATTISQNGDKHWSKRRQPLVKTVKNFGQNGEEFWSKRRQSLVKTATVVSQNGDSSQSGLWFKTAKNLAVIINNSLIARHFSKKIETGSVGFLDTTFVKTATVVSQDFCTKRRRI